MAPIFAALLFVFGPGGKVTLGPIPVEIMELCEAEAKRLRELGTSPNFVFVYQTAHCIRTKAPGERRP
jgi:hypothetical protein